MSAVPFYLHDIVRSKSTGAEGIVASCLPSGVRVWVDEALVFIPWEDGEIVTPAAAANALRDPKFQVWFDQQMANAYDQGVFEATGYMPGEAFGLVIKPHNPYRRTEQ